MIIHKHMPLYRYSIIGVSHLGLPHIMGSKKKVMSPLDLTSLKTYQMTIYLYCYDAYSQKYDVYLLSYI